MKQINYKTTGGDFLIVENTHKRHYYVTVYYTDGKTFCHSCGTVGSFERAHDLMEERAAMFGVSITDDGTRVA